MKLEQNKTHSVHLRLNDEQYAFCKDMSDIAGVGVSDFLRMLVNTTMVGSRKINVSLGDLENNADDKNIK